MLKLLLGGSPCTHWSIARGGGRETLPEGIGWELFRNYLIARDKFRPDLFLYENNKSAARPIKDRISRDLGVDLMYINSALVSAQNRQRFYAFNWTVPQPEDRGILLRDILESGEAFNAAATGKSCALKASCGKTGTANFTSGSHFPATAVAEPVRVGTIESDVKNESRDSKQYRVYSPDGKAVTLCGQGGGVGAKTGLYAAPCGRRKADRPQPIYEVRNGEIEIGGKKYPIRLQDGRYIIRKLTVTECCRLQTLPDDYCRAVSATQAYKGLGNGWTAEVIMHILRGALRDVPRDEKLVVLSMYDGIGTGRYCLDRLGFTNVEYHAYEIDKYAITVAKSNYPDILHHGDAFALRGPGWKI